MRAFKRICVFCGSGDGVDAAYAEAAIATGKLLAEKKIGLVYGGAKIGLMGAIANSVLVSSGEVIGVIPEKLQSREIAHPGLTELFIVESMHARKTMMAHLSSAFMVLPGGLGTLEEAFEILTWAMLRYHNKPLGFLNVNGYFDRLLSFLDHAVEEGFINPAYKRLLISAGDPAHLLKALQATELPEPNRWSVKP